MTRDLPPGTRVTLHAAQGDLPPGAAGVITSGSGSVYDVQFGAHVRAVNRVHLKVERAALEALPPVRGDLRPFVQYACVMGSRAFGLDTGASDTDLRGFYLPPARLTWGLSDPPEQLEFAAPAGPGPGTEEVYWEARKFVRLALKANPNVLEVLFSPMPVQVTPVARALLDIRGAFLSRLMYVTYGEYVRAQFRRLQADRERHGEIRPKHAMHLLRLLISGAHALRTGEVMVNVGPHREKLLAVKSGHLTWEAAGAWREELHRDFERAFAETSLPERPDHDAAQDWLIGARRAALDW